MARGLEVIAGAVPAQAVGWYPVTPRGEEAAGALITLSRSLPVDPERARREYVQRYRRDDPFAPRHLLDSHRPLLTMADIGGRKGLLSTLYGAELLPEYGVGFEAALYLRDGGRMLGAVRIARRLEDGDFTARELDFLHRAHLFLESSYGASLEPVPRLLQVELLTAKGLTAREVQVARAAATGATTPQIAGELVIAKSTVKSHLMHVFEKLGVRTRAELAALLGNPES